MKIKSVATLALFILFVGITIGHLRITDSYFEGMTQHLSEFSTPDAEMISLSMKTRLGKYFYNQLIPFTVGSSLVVMAICVIPFAKQKSELKQK